MLRLRNENQENTSHVHQIAGAAKANALVPKTPGQQPAGKTPARKVPLNDENSVYRAGKGKAKDAFQTPAPRDRAPLGAKTTNAKAKTIATPAVSLGRTKIVTQGKTPTQQRATSARRGRLRIHASPRSQLPDAGPLSHGLEAYVEDDADGQVEEEDVPEIDRALRLPQPNLADDDSDVEIDRTYPMLRPENLMRGAFEIYYNQKGPDGLTDTQRREKEWDEEAERTIADEERKITEQALTFESEDWDRLIADATGQEPPANTKVSNKRPPAGHARAQSTAVDRKPPSDALSKSAASALSSGPHSVHQRSVSTATGRFAAPTVASQAKQATVAKSTSHNGSALHHSKTRNAAGPLASRSTIGRAKGRHISAELRGGKPSMAERTQPTLPAARPEEGKAHADLDQSGGVIEYLTAKFQEEQERQAGVMPNLDEDNIEALREALLADIGDEYADFQFEMPEDVEL